MTSLQCPNVYTTPRLIFHAMSPERITVATVVQKQMVFLKKQMVFLKKQMVFLKKQMVFLNMTYHQWVHSLRLNKTDAKMGVAVKDGRDG